MGRSVLLLLMLCGVVLYKVQGQQYDPAADCPQTCQCEHPGRLPVGAPWAYHVRNGLYIHDCEEDLSTGLINILHTYPTIDGVQISNSLSHTAADAVYMTRLFTELATLSRLQLLSLSYNNLSVLPDAISNMAALQGLDMSHNQLSVLPDTIGSMAALQWLDMSHNLLSVLPWHNLRAAYYIDAAHNNITSIDMTSMMSVPHRQVNLSHNQITSLGAVPKGEPNFRSLDVSSNKLASLDTWHFRLGVLAPGTGYNERVLNVSNNAISNLTNNKGYSSMPQTNDTIDWKVDLTQNSVEYLHTISEGLNITEGKLVYLITSEHLILDDNPLNCDCEDYNMYHKLKQETQPPHLTCAAPANLRGHNIAAVGKDQFLCNLTGDCPPGCFCTDSPYNKSLNIYCTEYKETHLPQHVPKLRGKGDRYLVNFDGGYLENLTYHSYISDTVNASFRNNNINYITTEFFNGTNLTFVDLSNNQLSVVDAWPLRMILQQPEAEIYLDGNSISVFTNEIEYNPALDFSEFHHKIRNHIILSLENNNITHFSAMSNPWDLSTEIVEDLIEEDILELANNPFFCDCVDFEFYKVIHHKPNMTCAGPEDLEGRNLSQISLDKFKCVIKSGCPDGCTCLDIPKGYRQIQGLVTVVCHNYTGRKLPLHLPSPSKNTSDFKYSLTFEHGHLTHLEERDYLKQVVTASFSYNDIQEIDVGFFIILKTTDILRLDNNILQRLPASFVNRPNIELYLGQNEWSCKCENMATVRWIDDNKREITDYDNVTCRSPDYFKDKHFHNVSERLCSEHHEPPKIVENNMPDVAAIVISILLAIILLIIGVVYFKRVWLYKKLKLRPFHWGVVDEADKEFDVFISYCETDSAYVENVLLEWLEEAGYKVCHHKVNFLAGSIIWNIHRAIMKSKRTLAFFSSEYLNSGTCMHEFYTAFTLHVIERCNHLVTIKDRRIDIKTLDAGMQSYFTHYTYIDQDSPQFWDNLEYVMPEERMNAQARINENEVAQNANEMLMNIAALVPPD